MFDSIDTSHVVGLSGRALIGIMVYSFARVSAVVSMKAKDYYPNGERYWIRLHEKSGKFHQMPVHHTAECYLDEYIEAAGIAGEKITPLFRTTRGQGRGAGTSEEIKCHTFRATSITQYLCNGGTVKKAARTAAHESTRTTQLYGRTDDEGTLDEIERMMI